METGKNPVANWLYQGSCKIQRDMVKYVYRNLVEIGTCGENHILRFYHRFTNVDRGVMPSYEGI